MAQDDDKAGEVDEELARLAGTPPRRSPIIAGVVLLFAAVLGWHLRADLRYAFASRTAADVGDAATLAKRGVTLRDNSYVTVSGQPDHRNSLHIEPRGEKIRQDLFRLLGTGSHVFVRAADSTGRLDLKNQWTGRLRRFDALGWAPSVRAYYRDQVKSTRYFATDVLKRALRGDAGLTDRAGEPLTLAADQLILIDVSFPEELVVTMPGEKFPAPADAQHELERMGYKPAARAVVTRKIDGQDYFAIVILAPAAQRNKILDDLEAKGIPAAAFEDRWAAALSTLRDGGDALVVGTQSVPWAQVRAAGVDAPIAIADDAYVLTEGEAPGAFWWAPALMVVLLAFAGFNVWYLLRARRA
jgi:hypothetical protein